MTTSSFGSPSPKIPFSRFLVAEWGFVQAGIGGDEVRRPAKTGFAGFSELEVVRLGSGKMFGLFRMESSASLPEFPHALVLDSELSFLVVQSFYGLVSGVLHAGHGVATFVTQSIPLGFAIAHVFAREVGPGSLLECKIDRLGGGARLCVGGATDRLQQTMGNLGFLLKTLHPGMRSRWDESLVPFPDRELRRRYSFIGESSDIGESSE